MVKHASFSGWRERFHAVAMRRNGGERSWIWAAVHLSTTIMGAPQLGQVQRGLGCLAAETAYSTCGSARSVFIFFAFILGASFLKERKDGRATYGPPWCAVGC